jgi:hypothetical protein
VTQFLYRFKDYYATPPEEGGRLLVELVAYPVVRATPCGVWVQIPHTARLKFVNTKARKQFACATVKAARLSFYARKKRQVAILKYQLKRAKQALAVVSKVLNR